MKLSHRDSALIVVGLVLVGTSIYFTVTTINRQNGSAGTGASGMVPESEGQQRSLVGISGEASLAGVSMDANILGVDAKGNITINSWLTHFFHPNGPRSACNPPNQQYTDTKVRYPTTTGTNISTLIHHGMSPLSTPHPRDYAWMVNPPAEVQF